MTKKAFHYGDISSFLLNKNHFIRFLSKHLRYRWMVNRPLRSKCNMQYATCNNTIGLWYNHISMWSWLFWRWIDLHMYTIVYISYPVILYSIYSNKEMKKMQLILYVDKFFYFCKRKKNFMHFLSVQLRYRWMLKQPLPCERNS